MPEHVQCASSKSSSEFFQEWRLIPGHEIQYLACSRGLIYSFVKNGFLDSPPNQYGYYYATLWNNGKPFQKRIHQLIALAFLGPCPPGMQVNHKNGDKLDNCVKNLEYVTSAENTRHAVEHRLMHSGERSPHAKLSNQQAKEIRQNYRLSDWREVVRKYGLSRRGAYRVMTGESYKHAG